MPCCSLSARTAFRNSGFKVPRCPVKVPLALAVLSAAVVPVLAVLYAGLYGVELFGLLSIFGTLATVLDVLLSILFLVLVWGGVYVLGAFLKGLECVPGDRKIFFGLFRLLSAFACVLSVLSPLYSIFSESPAFCIAWTFAFSIELVTGIVLGILIARLGLRGKNHLVLGIGLAVAFCYLTDFSGFRTFESMIDYSFASGDVEESDRAAGAGLLTYLWGLSPAEVDTLDEESLADVQEVSVVFFALLFALFAGFVAAHAAFSLLSFSLFAIYFVRKRNGGAVQNSEGVLC